MRLHAYRFQGIKQEMRVDLIGQHLEFDLLLFEFKLFLLPVGSLDLFDEFFDAANHQVILSR